MRLLIFLVVVLGAPSLALAQDPSEEQGVRSAEEIPQDMPPPPDDAPPAEAPPVDGTDERPPHPETPQDLAEPQPSAEVLAKTSYHWLPGHWVWTGQQFEWKSGIWIHAVKDMILVPPKWEWSGQQWVFHDAGWAKPGTNDVVYRPTPAPGNPDAVSNAEAPPGAATQTTEPQPATTTVYVYTGVYVAPLIVSPIWHPWYHSHWYHRHVHYRRPPAYRHARYRYAHTHRVAHHHHHTRPPSSSRPPSQGGANRPSTRPSQPPSGRAGTGSTRNRGSYRGGNWSGGGRRGGGRRR